MAVSDRKKIVGSSLSVGSPSSSGSISSPSCELSVTGTSAGLVPLASTWLV